MPSLASATSTASTTSTSTGTSQSATARASLATNMDTFLKLLTTQLSHQDPLSPMDSTQFTNQLVQYSSVEQEININSNLEKMLTTNNSVSMASAVGYIGTTVTGVASSLPLQDGSSQFSYTTPSGANKVTAILSDSSGNIVRAMSLDSSTGTHTTTWDGTDSYGSQLKDGAYSVKLTATLSDGSTQDMDASVWGKVTSIGMDSSSQVQLFMGNVNLPLKDVIKVESKANTSATSSTTTTTTQNAA